MDIFLTGNDNVTGAFANLYKNLGTGNFSFELVSTPFTGVPLSAVADFDQTNGSQGFLDVSIGGSLGTTNSQILEVHRNNGDVTFTLS